MRAGDDDARFAKIVQGRAPLEVVLDGLGDDVGPGPAPGRHLLKGLVDDP